MHPVIVNMLHETWLVTEIWSWPNLMKVQSHMGHIKSHTWNFWRSHYWFILCPCSSLGFILMAFRMPGEAYFIPAFWFEHDLKDESIIYKPLLLLPWFNWSPSLLNVAKFALSWCGFNVVLFCTWKVKVSRFLCGFH